MTRRVCGAVLVGLAVAAARGADDAAVTIKAYQSKPGDRERVTAEEKSTTKTAVAAGGRTTETAEAKGEKLVYVQEVVDKPAGAKRATKLTRAYETAEATTDGAAETLPYHGKTVVIEKAGNRYAFAYADGGPLDGAAAARLDKEFNRPDGAPFGADGLLPDKPVRPGDTWAVDQNKLAQALAASGMEVDREKMTATGKLVKTYAKGGRRFGVIDYRFGVPVTGLGPKVPLVLKDGSRVDVTSTVDVCIDGTDDGGKAEFTNKTRVVGTANGAEVTVEADVVSTRTSETLPRK